MPNILRQPLNFLVVFCTLFIVALSHGVDEAASQTLPTDGLRDPFWPVGWMPQPVADKGAVTGPQPKSPIRWEDAAELLRISGLSAKPDGSYLAIIKGVGVVEENDIISVNFSGLSYRWKVIAISNTGIKTERIGVISQR